MGHRDSLIDAQALELVEHRYVRHVGRIATINLSGSEYADRYTTTLHRTDLNRRRLRTKSETFRRVERVLRFACRMSFANIQCVEVIVVRLDLAIIFDRVT